MVKKEKKKLFKRFVRCNGCGKKFQAEHKLRLYCNNCKNSKSHK